jgi:N-acetylglucosaminyl-diphospho-decaprenol L-rhamnosyltransferase
MASAMSSAPSRGSPREPRRTPEKATERSASPLLNIIVVTSNGACDHVRTCLCSLERYPLTAGPMTVSVVDNASTDGTSETVRDEFPWVDLIQLDWNAGFCIANNIAIRRTSAPYTLLLNPDTEVYEGSLDHIFRLMQERPDIGMSSCRLAQPDGTFDHAAKRSFPTPVGALAEFTGIGRKAANGTRLSRVANYRAHDLGEYESGEVDAVNGAFMFCRRAAIEEVGLLDEAYWLYMDDLDWCYRFKEAGWKVWYDGSTTVMHVKGGTTTVKRHRGLRHNVAFHRSMGRFYRKFYAAERPFVDIAVYLGLGAKLAISLARSAATRRTLR